MRGTPLSICSFCIPDKLTAGGKCFVLHTRSAHEFCGWHRDAVHRAEDDPDDHLSGGITVKVCTAAWLRQLSHDLRQHLSATVSLFGLP